MLVEYVNINARLNLVFHILKAQNHSLVHWPKNYKNNREARIKESAELF